MEPLLNDPYRACEHGHCNHDLARAVSVDELLDGDGPFPPTYLVVNLSPAARHDAAGQGSLFDDDRRPVEAASRAS